MEYVFQIALVLIPAGAVFLTAYYMLKNQTSKELHNLKVEIKRERQKTVFPNQLEAYQRLILLMDRISPPNLIMRNQKPGLPAMAYQGELLQMIRNEFDHNTTQQLFVSHGAWDLVKSAKEESIKMINVAASKLPADATGLQLSQVVLEIVAQLEKLPTDVATEYVKAEFQKKF